MPRVLLLLLQLGPSLFTGLSMSVGCEAYVESCRRYVPLFQPAEYHEYTCD